MPYFLVHSISSCNSVICFFFLIAKYLYIINYSSNTFAVLVCLVNLPPKDVLTQLLSKRHSKEFTSLPRSVEGYDEWWCYIKLHIATFCFGSNFERKILELHTFVNTCIFSYFNIVLSMQWAYRFINYALLSNWILLFYSIYRHYYLIWSLYSWLPWI